MVIDIFPLSALHLLSHSFTVRHIIYIYISIFLEIIISEQSYTTSSIIAPFQLEDCVTRVVLVPIKTPIKDSPSRKSISVFSHNERCPPGKK